MTSAKFWNFFHATSLTSSPFELTPLPLQCGRDIWMPPYVLLERPVFGHFVAGGPTFVNHAAPFPPEAEAEPRKDVCEIHTTFETVDCPSV